MKKLTAWILALALLCGSLSACGGQPPVQSGSEAAPQAQPEEISEVTHKLFADWYAYLSRCEYLYGDMLWALSYLEPFFENHSWDSLQTARAALSLAERRAVLIDPPEAVQMTFEDYDKLIQSGADVSPVQYSVDSIPSLKSSVLVDYQVYRNRLNSPAEGFFLTYDLAGFEDWAGLKRQFCELNLQICADETDYVLLQVDDEEEEARLIEAISEVCPQINARRAGNPQDPDALLKDVDGLLDEIERLLNELSANVGQSQANLDQTAEAMEIDTSGGMEVLSQYAASMAANAVELSGFPAALPYPDWWYEQEYENFMFSWEDGEGGEHDLVLPGDTIEAPPDGYFAEWPDVPLEEYQAYLANLKLNGISAEFITEDEGKHTAFFQVQTGSFAIIWEENTASFLTMEGSVCFAPLWYVLQHPQAAF